MLAEAQWIAELRSLRDTADFAEERRRLFADGIRLVAFGESDYPPLLAKIHLPPAVLYYRGKLPSQNDFPLAVVGSRTVSEYGIAAINRIVGGVAGLPVCVISGLALGADGKAHECALENELPTVAVLGSGIDERSIYPAGHGGMARLILSAGGCLLSEYPPGVKPRKEYFPARNRIIAGMSRAVLVAEAGLRSGTLITAHAAIDEGRDVWAIPGPIFSSLSAATNALIADGAYLADNAQRIIDSYEQLRLAQSETMKTSIGKPNDTIETDNQTDNLGTAILQTIAKRPSSPEDLCGATQRGIAEVNTAVTLLEIGGKIRVLDGLCYPKT